MTAQCFERIIIDGVEHLMAAEPLLPYLRTLEAEPNFDEWTGESSTSLYRGYIGQWEVRDQRLYLVAMKSESGAPIDMARLFPDRTPPIHASWYSGKLRLPMGEQLMYVHHGWASAYAEQLILHVRSGCVTRVRKIDMRPHFVRRMIDAFRESEDSDKLVPVNPFLMAWLSDEGQHLLANAMRSRGMTFDTPLRI
jgi:hypothetical protein